MSITSEEKQRLISKFQKGQSDTGSEDVQIAVLTERIKNLTEHFKTHKKDHHSRRGLLGLVSRRRKLLQFVKRKDYQRYLKLLQELNLRK